MVDDEHDDGTDPAEEADAEAPFGDRPTWQVAAGAVAVVAVVAVGALLAFNVFDGEDSGGGEAPEQAIISDDFDRPDDTAELGSTADGLSWEAVTGTWGIQGGEAVLVAPNESGPRSVAVVQAPGADGTVLAEAGNLTTGWGLVFRYKGEFNYWYLIAQPDFATYNLGRVVDGENEALGGVGLAQTEDGVQVEIVLDGPTIEINVNGELARALTDTTLMRATGVGLLASGELATDASWAYFEADLPATDAPEFEFPDTTTTTAGPGGSPATTTTEPTP